MPHSTSLISLLVAGFVLAFALGMLARQVRLSPIVGYLVAGIVVGPHTPGFVGDAALAPQLAEIGVILLMFGVGMHFSIDDLLSVRAIAIPGALAQIAVATVLGWGLATLLGWSTMAGILFGFSLATASTVVLLRAMEQRRLLDTRRGKIAVGWLVVEDLACVIALVLIPALAQMAASGRETDPLAVLGALAATLAKVGAFIAFMLLVGRRVIPWLLEQVAGTGSRELFTLSILAIALGVALGSAELFGVSFALGAFFAGVVLSESEFSHQAAHESLPLRDAFAVLFFVSVGMLFDPRILVEQPLHVLATTLIIVFGKSAAAYAIVRAFGHPQSTALTISTSLAQIGEFAFIVAGLSLSLGLLPAEGHALVIAGSLISIMLNPLLFALLDRREHRILRETRAAQDIASAPVPTDIADHVILVGYGRVGQEFSRLMLDHGVPVVVIEDDDHLVDRARAAGLPTIRGNAVSERVLEEALPARATTAMLAIPNVLESGEAIARLRVLNPGLSIVARAHSDAEVRHLLEHGADAAVMAERELAHSLGEMVLSMPQYRGARSLPAVGAVQPAGS